MNEYERQQKVVRLFRESRHRSETLARIAQMLAELGSATLFILRPHGNSIFSETRIDAFLTSRDFPFRGVYAASLRDGDVLVLCLGSWGSPDSSMQSLVEQVANRLAEPREAHREYEAA